MHEPTIDRTADGREVVECRHCGGRYLRNDLATLRANGWHCSRDDDPTQHDRPAWVARALAGTLPAKVLA